MSEVLEYYLTGGHIRLGKNEAALELLRLKRRVMA